MLYHITTGINPGHHLLGVPLPHRVMVCIEISIVANCVRLLILLLLLMRYAGSLLRRHEGAGRGAIGISRSISSQARMPLLLPSCSISVCIPIIKCAFLILLLY